MDDRVLKQRINIEVSMKLGRFHLHLHNVKDESRRNEWE
jgi:hypothetical protein